MEEKKSVCVVFAVKIKESAENYLETILMLTKRNGEVRSIDIANELGYSKPSISVAMKNFKEDGLISVDSGGYISLTEKGMEIAGAVYERHKLLIIFLAGLGVDEATAMKDACRIEHVISETTFEKLKEFAASHNFSGSGG